MGAATTQRCSWWALALLGFGLAFACDGTAVPRVDGGVEAPSAEPAPEPAPDATGSDTPVDLDLGSEMPALDARDAAREPVPTPELPTQSLPADAAPPLRLVDGETRLIGGGSSACTSQVPASGDRWCAFRRAVAGTMDGELWVINITAAAKDGAPACDGSNPNCLRLTTKLWTDTVLLGPSQSQAHRFDGDTLLFGAEGGAAFDEAYRGGIFAWRPGWPAARKLTSTGLICYGHGRVAAVLCVLNAQYPKGLFIPTDVDVAAGLLDGPVGPELPILEHVKPQRTDGMNTFSAGLSMAGDHAIFSGPRAQNPATSSLRIARLVNNGAEPPREILLDAMDWGIGNDDSKVYYMAEVGPGRSGALMVADFPSGANPVRIARRTNRYFILYDGTRNDLGVGYFVEGMGRFLSEYRVVPDLRKPFSSTAVFRYNGNLQAVRPSPDQRFTIYIKETDEGYEARVARNDGSSECLLNVNRGRPSPVLRILDHGGLVFWSETADGDPEFREGWLSDPDCANPRRYAARVGFYTPVRDEGLVFGDEYNLDNDTVTLRYARFEPGGTQPVWPSAGAVTIATGVGLPVLYTPDNQLIFTMVGKGPTQDGIYLFRGLPFAASVQ